MRKLSSSLSKTIIPTASDHLAGTIQLKVVDESASKVEQASCLFIENAGECTEEFMVAFSSESALREARQGQARCLTYLNCIVLA